VAIAYLPNKGLDATGTAVDLVEGDLANDLAAVISVILSIVCCGGCGCGCAYLRSFLIFSISPGSFWAKVSFNDCN
jgi:hypothetical protein